MSVRACHANHSARLRKATTRRFETLECRRLLALTPELLVDATPGNQYTNVTELVVAGERLFFRVGDRSYATGVWMVENTGEGLAQLYDPTLDPLYDDEESFYAIDNLTAVGDRFYFASHFECGGSSIWTLGPEEQQTRQVISYDFSSIWCYGSAPGGLTAANGQLFFVGGGSHDYHDADGEPWVSDGTSAGTRLVRDINPGWYEYSGEVQEYRSYPQHFTEFQGEIYFAAQVGAWPEPSGHVWKTDGTEDGTVRLQPVCDETAANCAEWPRSFTSVGERMFFAADNLLSGTEVWVTDGTDAGTRVVKDIAAGEFDAFRFRADSPNPFWKVNDRVFFAADDRVHGNELWVSDGTEAGTVLVKDIHPTGGSAAREGVELDGQLIFVANDGVHGEELWTSDGTAEGTRLLADIHPSTTSAPRELTRVGNYVFFTASDGVNGREQWATDGTIEGTRMLELHAGVTGSDAQHLTAMGDTLYFSANDGIYGKELWKVLVEDIPSTGDTDGDGDVDLDDLNNVRNYFGATGEDQTGDTDGNGVVDLADLNAVRSNFGNPNAAPLANWINDVIAEAPDRSPALPSASIHDAVFSQFVAQSQRDDATNTFAHRKLSWSRFWR
jgi:ELWxxDGT repeat protein